MGGGEAATQIRQPDLVRRPLQAALVQAKARFKSSSFTGQRVTRLPSQPFARTSLIRKHGPFWQNYHLRWKPIQSYASEWFMEYSG
jgi:hypothetical protein